MTCRYFLNPGLPRSDPRTALRYLRIALTGRRVVAGPPRWVDGGGHVHGHRNPCRASARSDWRMQAPASRCRQNTHRSRLRRFVDRCRRAGLLRAAGAGYQFRHRELQDHLAAHRLAPAEKTASRVSLWGMHPGSWRTFHRRQGRCHRGGNSQPRHSVATFRAKPGSRPLVT